MEHIFTDDAPEEFLDPVTMVLMRDPVVLPSGETYERETIKKAGLRDPQTREQLVDKNLTSNRALRRQIDKYLKTCVEKRIAQVQAAGIEGWDGFQELLCALVDDSSDPALFAQTQLLSFLRDESSADALLSRSMEQQKVVVTAMLGIRSTLVKECLLVLLSWYSRPTQREPASRPKRAKRTASSRSSPEAPAPSLAYVTPPITFDNSTVAKLGLGNLFSSHDDSEVELASSYALVLMQEPFSSNILNLFSSTDESINSLDAVLCSKAAKDHPEAVQNLILSLAAWSSVQGATLAAQKFSSAEKLYPLINGIFTDPCPEGTKLELVLTPLLRNTADWQNEAKTLLCENARGLITRLAEEVVGGALPQTEWIELLVSLMHVGVSLDDVVAANTSGSLRNNAAHVVSAPTFIAVIDKIAAAIPTGFSVDLLTRQSVSAFSSLSKCKLNNAFFTGPGSRMSACIEMMTESTTSGLDTDGTRILLEALLIFCQKASQASSKEDEWTAMVAALQVAINIRPHLDGEASLAMLSHLAAHFGSFVVKNSPPTANSAAKRKEIVERTDFAQTALAVLSIRHGDIDMTQVIGAEDSRLHLAVCQTQLQLTKLQLDLNKPTKNPKDSLAKILVLLKAHLYEESYAPSLNVFTQLEEVDNETIVEIMQHLYNWCVNSTTWLSMSHGLELLNTIAIGIRTKKEVRLEMIDGTSIVKIVFDILGSGDRVYAQDGENLDEALLAAVRLLDTMLGERTQACGMTLPPDLVRKRIVQKLTILMKRSSDKEELCIAACSCLFKVTARCREVEFTAEQIEQLSSCLDLFKSSVSIHASVFGIQMYLSTRRRYKKQLSLEHHVQRCLMAVEPEDAILEVIKPACGVLRNAARNITEESSAGDRLHVFPWLPIVNAAVRIMRRHPKDAEVQYRTCGVLVNIATCPYGANVAESPLEEALPLVQKAMRTHEKHAELHMWSLHFFLQYNMSSAMPSTVGNDVLKTVERYSDNAELQLLGMSVAHKLAIHLGQTKLKKADWVPGMLARLYACCEKKECLEFEDLPLVAIQLLTKLLEFCSKEPEQLAKARSVIMHVQNINASSVMNSAESRNDVRREVDDACEEGLQHCNQFE